MPKYLLISHVVKLVESQIERVGSQDALAKEWEVNASYLSNVRKGKQLPGPKICQHLGIKSLVVYVEDGD